MFLKLLLITIFSNYIFRYVIEDNRAIFMYKDGSQAWIAKDYLIGEERCESVTIDNKVYEGKHFSKVRKLLFYY